jgi:uncharacterized integral membrane protein
MLKSMIAFMAVLLILLFALSNVHNIQLHFITGNPFTVRLASVVLFSYLLGVLSASYFFVMAGFNAKRKARKRAGALQADEEEDEEDL